jgi:hypothetical protein
MRRTRRLITGLRAAITPIRPASSRCTTKLMDEAGLTIIVQCTRMDRYDRRTNANRGGECDSNDGNSHQEFAGHVTLLFTFRIRLRHPMLDRYAGTGLACLANERCLASWNTAPLLPVWSCPLTGSWHFRGTARTRHNQVIRVYRDGAVRINHPSHRSTRERNDVFAGCQA